MSIPLHQDKHQAVLRTINWSLQAFDEAHRMKNVKTEVICFPWTIMYNILSPFLILLCIVVY